MLERPTAADGFAFAQPEHCGARRTYSHVPPRLSQSFRSLETLRFAVVFVAANEILELPLPHGCRTRSRKMNCELLAGRFGQRYECPRGIRNLSRPAQPSQHRVPDCGKQGGAA
jgi:hypothetical protein